MPVLEAAVPSFYFCHPLSFYPSRSIIPNLLICVQALRHTQSILPMTFRDALTNSDLLALNDLDIEDNFYSVSDRQADQTMSNSDPARFSRLWGTSPLMHHQV